MMIIHMCACYYFCTCAIFVTLSCPISNFHSCCRVSCVFVGLFSCLDVFLTFSPHEQNIYHQEELKEWDQCLLMLGDAKVDDHGNVNISKDCSGMYLDKDGEDREINVKFIPLCYLYWSANLVPSIASLTFLLPVAISLMSSEIYRNKISTS